MTGVQTCALPISSEISLFPKAGLEDHILGDLNADVSIIVYSDFQCASCAQLAPILKNIIAAHPGKVNQVFRNFPLVSMHDKAALAAQAAEAASLQSKFWEMHDYLYKTQADWINKNPVEFHQWLLTESSIPGLDIQKFQTDLDSTPIKELIIEAWNTGQKIKLPGAPVILVNGEIIKWQSNLFSQLEDLVNLAVLSKNQINICPPAKLDPAKKYSAIIKTNKGEIVIDLFSKQSPFTVNNFLYLSRKKWYDGNSLFRVIPGFIVQTGDPSGTGLGGPGYFFEDEKNNLTYDRAGLVGMSNTGPDTNGSQFFITLAPESKLNHQYTIFGEVTKGMDVLMNLPARDPAIPGGSQATDYIISISIVEK